jgi:hypothetical protein
MTVPEENSLTCGAGSFILGAIQRAESISGVAGHQQPGAIKPAQAEVMYKCQICGNNSQPRTPAYRITIESRQTHYPHRAKAHACRKLQRDGTTKFVRTDDPGGSGLERAREALVCHGCFVKLMKPA